MTAPVPTERVKALTEKVERLRQAAHEAPMNPFRLNADGHRWIEPLSRAWAARANEYAKACDELDHARAVLATEGGEA